MIKQKVTWCLLFLWSFHIKEGYNAKLKKNDPLHNVGLNANESKPVPILSSSVYDQHSPLEQTSASNENFRVAYVHSDFYESSGTKIPYTTWTHVCVSSLSTLNIKYINLRIASARNATD